jgi:nitrite reductase/ring-hydroxylating ferredoxin subunit
VNGTDPERLTVAPDGKPEEAQPPWRRDFPIDWPEDRYVSQRDFIKFLLLTSLGFVVGQFWLVARRWLRPREGALLEKPIARLEEIAVGGSRVFHYPGETEPRILVRLSETSFVAFDQECTHLTCPVIPRPAEGELHCPCHKGRFDLASGRPIAGPPRRALSRVVLETRGDTLYAVGIESSI